MISVIIPVKPPEPHLQTLQQQIHKILKDQPHEILVQTELGLGHAVECGVKKSRGNIIVIMDADGSHDPSELPKMISLLSLSNIVLGSRYISSGINNDTFSRRTISRIYNSFTRHLLGSSLHDPMTGFIVTKREVFEDYVFPSGYKFMLPLYASQKYKIKEYPITFNQRKIGESKTSLITGLSTFTLLTKLFLHKNKGDLFLLLRLPFYCVFGYCVMYLYFLLLSSPILYTLVIEKPILGWMIATLVSLYQIFKLKLQRLK